MTDRPEDHDENYLNSLTGGFDLPDGGINSINEASDSSSLNRGADKEKPPLVAGAENLTVKKGVLMPDNHSGGEGSTQEDSAIAEKPTLPKSILDTLIETAPVFNNPAVSFAFPIIYLGYSSDICFYFHRSTGRTYMWPPSQHTELNFYSMMSKDEWVKHFPDLSHKERPDWKAIASKMMEESAVAGIFNPDVIRGRGAWVDGEDVTVNVGDDVIGFCKSNHLYLQKTPILAPNAIPLSTDDAKYFLKICRALPFNKKSGGLLLAGWCVCAVICGALKWRPHLWLTGGRGTGKSYALAHIIAAALGKNSIIAQGETTAAGIRQRMDADALPVVFDEAESENHAAGNNIQNVLALARQASSENSGEILKGGQTGKYVSYRVRSCFLMASIAPALIQAADQSRFTVLELCRHHQKIDFKDLKAMQKELLQPGFADAFFLRAIELAPIIRANAEHFIDAASKVYGTRRAGDQIGTLLAGGYSLISQGEITPDEAMAYIKAIEADIPETLDDRDDPERLKDYLFETKIDVDVLGQKKQFTIGKMIAYAQTTDSSEYQMQKLVAPTFSEIGIKYEDGFLIVSNTHRAIRDMIKDTQWSKNHAQVLKRLKGADNYDNKAVKFSGEPSKVTRIPVT